MTMRTFRYFACENAPVPDNDPFPGAGRSLTLQATEKQDNEQDINPSFCKKYAEKSIL